MSEPKLYISLFLLLCLAGCVPYETSQNNAADRLASRSYSNSFSIPQQQAPPPRIQSLQLYRKGSPFNPPVIRLESAEQLVLEFDYLGDTAKQYRIEVTHRNRDWSESPLDPGFYLDGFNTAYFSGGLKSLGQQPSYFHFTFEFPNDQFSFKASGNYLLAVYDYDTGEMLFTLPFFITEDEGTLETRVEQLFARREDLRRQDQLFSRYVYPEYVEFPKFDLAFQYVQNQFWGRAREVDFFDTSSPGEVHFHLSQDQAFVRDYEFNMLNLRRLEADGRQIVDVQEGPVPPKVILRRDVQNFQGTLSLETRSRFGLPVDARNASYARVLFRLETEPTVSTTQRIYLVGDFNNWTINERNRMTYNPDSKWWEGEALIKEGQYSYKYVTLQNREIDDLALDQSFISSTQEYLTLIYYKDPARRYDRLLQVGQTIGK